MSIGGENRAGHVSINNLQKMANQCGLERVGITAEGCAELLDTYADAIPEKLAKVFDGLERSESAVTTRELRARMEEPVAHLCKKARKMLQN